MQHIVKMFIMCKIYRCVGKKTITYETVIILRGMFRIMLFGKGSTFKTTRYYTYKNMVLFPLKEHNEDVWNYINIRSSMMSKTQTGD